MPWSAKSLTRWPMAVAVPVRAVLRDGLPASRRPRQGIGIVEVDEVLVMDCQMPSRLGCLVDLLEPYVAGR